MLNYKGKSIFLSNNSYVNERIIIKDFPFEVPNFKKKVFYNCDICGEEYLTGNSIRGNCRKICLKHHFYYTCDFCKKEFEIIRLSDFISSDKNERFCSHNCALQYRNRTNEMKQAVTMMNKSRVKQNLNLRQVCQKCNKEFISIFKMEICNACITTETNIKNSKIDQICQKCGKIFNSTFIMEIGPCCNANIGGIPNFITKNNVRYYKNIEVHEFCFKILSGELDINNYPGINIRFGEVYYNSENILTGEINKFNNSDFYEKDEELWYYDRSIYDYVPWQSFKGKFKTQNINFQLPEGFKLIITFRNQDSEDWCGSKQAFEQSLVDENIGWFVYIKFDENNNPLVIGKSGSLLVNKSGSDLNFSIDVNDGPARKFLKEEGLNWCKTQIAIYPCKTEQEAYSLEKDFCIKYNLFQS